MTARQAWRRLGIAPTDDARAIRRAYAAKLKALDVDADPAGFEALREAREYALVLAQNMASGGNAGGEDWDEAEEDSPLAEIAAEILADSDDESRAVAAQAAVERDPYDDRASALYDLLGAADGYTPLIHDEVALARDHLHFLLGDPRLEAIDRRTDVENWLAMLLVNNSPRSDPLLYTAAEAFGWRGQAGGIEEDWWVRSVNERIQALVLRSNLESGQHSLSAAWRELTRPLVGSTASRHLLIRRSKVKALIAKIRNECPSLEEELVPERVAVYDEVSGNGCSSTWILMVVAVQVVLAISRCNPVTSPVAPPVPVVTGAPSVALPTPANPLGPALESFDSGLTPQALQAAQPTFAAELAELAKKPDAHTAIFRQLAERMFVAVPLAEPSLVRDYAKQRRAIFTTLRSEQPDQCLRFVQGQSIEPVERATRLLAPLRAVGARIILATQVPLKAKLSDGRFRLNGEMLGQAKDWSGLTLDQLQDALNGKGTPRNICSAWMAVIDAALAGGDKGLVVLRAM